MITAKQKNIILKPKRCDCTAFNPLTIENELSGKAKAIRAQTRRWRLAHEAMERQKRENIRVM